MRPFKIAGGRLRRSGRLRAPSQSAGRAVERMEQRVLLSTYGVTSTADSGPGSLRQAILDANAHPGEDAIAFAIDSGVQTISAAGAFPAISDPVVIDGTTQPGYAGKPLVQVTGFGL